MLPIIFTREPCRNPAAKLQYLIRCFSFSIDCDIVVVVHAQSQMFWSRSNSGLNLDNTTTNYRKRPYGANHHPGPPPLQHIDEDPKITDNGVHLFVLMRTGRKKEY